MVYIAGNNIFFLDAAFCFADLFRQMLDFGEQFHTPQPFHSLQNHFKSVVFFGIVGSGNHNPRLVAQLADGKINAVYGNQPDVFYINSFVGYSFDKRLFQHRP